VQTKQQFTQGHVKRFDIWYLFMNFKELPVFSLHSNIPKVPWRDPTYRLYTWSDHSGVFTHDAEL